MLLQVQSDNPKTKNDIQSFNRINLSCRLITDSIIIVCCSASEKARDSWKKYLAYENSKIVGG